MPKCIDSKAHVGQDNAMGQALLLPPTSMGILTSLWMGGEDQCSERAKCLREVKQAICLQIRQHGSTPSHTTYPSR